MSRKNTSVASAIGSARTSPAKMPDSTAPERKYRQDMAPLDPKAIRKASPCKAARHTPANAIRTVIFISGSNRHMLIYLSARADYTPMPGARKRRRKMGVVKIEHMSTNNLVSENMRCMGESWLAHVRLPERA